MENGLLHHSFVHEHEADQHDDVAELVDEDEDEDDDEDEDEDDDELVDEDELVDDDEADQHDDVAELVDYEGDEDDERAPGRAICGVKKHASCNMESVLYIATSRVIEAFLEEAANLGRKFIVVQQERGRRCVQ